ncbi:MAG: uroporphyrinogen-III synthase [Coriobacteriia bacterium]
MSAKPPLAGRAVLVTRTREQSASLAGPLAALGAEVVPFPVISIEEPEDVEPVARAVRELASYDWIVLTSANGVERFFARVVSTDRTEEALSKVKIAAIGSATAERIAGYGVVADLVPKDFRAEGLVDAFREMGAGPGWRVLVPRAQEGREVLPDALRALGATVDVVAVYRTVLAAPDPAALERLRGGTVDAVTFTSGSTVRGFLEALRDAGLDPAAVMERLVVASIGPVTTKALSAAGFHADVEAAEATADGLVRALVERLSD